VKPGRQVPPWRERFVERDAGYITPCLEWTGSLNDGYGTVRIDGTQWKVHRLVWAEAHGHPGQKHVLHKCDNRSCGRLGHLFLGTNADNVADRTVKNRSAAPGVTPDIVRSIRFQATAGVEQKQLAQHYGLAESTISRIVNHKRWRHI
jgi:hypothetical protein